MERRLRTQIVHLIDRSARLDQSLNSRRVAPQRSDVESGLTDRISVGNSSSRLENVLDRHDVVALRRPEQRVLLPLEDLRGTGTSTTRLGPNGLKIEKETTHVHHSRRRLISRK